MVEEWLRVPVIIIKFLVCWILALFDLENIEKIFALCILLSYTYDLLQNKTKQLVFRYVRYISFTQFIKMNLFNNKQLV